jgi:hypothetical protein
MAFHLRSNDWFLLGNFGFSVTVVGKKLLFWPIAADEVQRRLAGLNQAVTLPQQPPSVSHVPPPPPSSRAAVRAPSQPSLDTQGNIFLNGAQLVHLVASPDPIGTVKELKGNGVGVWQLTIDKNFLMTDELATVGWDQSSRLFIQSNDGTSVVLPNYGPMKRDETLKRKMPHYIQEMDVFRIAKKDRKILPRSA